MKGIDLHLVQDLSAIFLTVAPSGAPAPTLEAESIKQLSLKPKN